MTARFITGARAIAAQGFDLLNRAQEGAARDERLMDGPARDRSGPGDRPPR